MNKKLLSVLIISLLFLVNLSIMRISAEENKILIEESIIIYVDDNKPSQNIGTMDDPYRRIQTAVNNANNGDTIFIFDGVYEENVTVNKSLTLVGETLEGVQIYGEPSVIFDGVKLISKQRNFIFNVQANNVKISNLSIVGCEDENNEYGPLDTTINGILIDSFENVNISNLIIGACRNCITVEKSSKIDIYRIGFLLSRNAIKVGNSSEISISRNSFSASECSINAKEMLDSNITKNNFLFNLKAILYKISLQNFKDRVVIDNNFWLIPRAFPKIIFIKINLNDMEIPWILLDKNPADELYPY